MTDSQVLSSPHTVQGGLPEEHRNTLSPMQCASANLGSSHQESAYCEVGLPALLVWHAHQTPPTTVSDGSCLSVSTGCTYPSSAW